MDWDNDYYTFSDTNIEYIWRFLKTVHERGWLYKGHRSTQWCPRCGTSLSQHEQAGEENYQELEHPSLFVRFPLVERAGESLVVWTTTPWTLPANVAAAVKPDAEYGLRDGQWRLAVSGEEYAHVARGEELVGLHYTGPFDDLPAAVKEHRVIPWDDVSLTEGTGIVHIAPGAGTEDFELGRIHDLPVIVPIDESGRMLPGFGLLEGLSTGEVEDVVIEDLRERELLVEAGRITHRYPICWRCKTPLLFRVVDDWFISSEPARQELLDANATVEWTPSFYSKRMDDWLRNMGDWNISRKRYFGLPLPFYPCDDCGLLNVVGSRAELEERAMSGLDQLQELHRPWIDNVPITCEGCGNEIRRIPEVGDAWLDAGIVPFSTLGWENPEWVEHGYATGASQGLSGADLPDQSYWEQWFPADWISESREQIRLWFYSMLFMSVTLEGRAPYERVLAYERVRDETGREMHKSTGNAIEANEAIERMGADVMRWMYSEQVPSQNLNFGYGPAHEIRRRLLTLWNSVKFFVDYANVSPGAEVGELEPLDRWLLSRVEQLVAEATDAYERFWTPDVVASFEAFVDDLSNWYIRRSRRRFWDGDSAALETLRTALLRSLVVIAPVMPFLSEHLWRVLRQDEQPESIFLTSWPEVGERDEQLLAEVGETRRVVDLGRQARAGSQLPLRQPLRRIVVQGAPLAERHVDEIREELRVKEVEFGDVEATELRVKPNLPVLGPKLGKELGAVRAALEAGEFEEANGGFRVAGHDLSAGEVLVERVGREGWAVAHADGITVALDTALDPELEVEKRVLDLIHELNAKRKEAGLELTDRIVVTLPHAASDLLEHEDWIKNEVLAVEIRTDGGSTEPQIAKA
jgi:isoleucyl-tRNA synthetase